MPTLLAPAGTEDLAIIAKGSDHRIVIFVEFQRIGKTTVTNLLVNSRYTVLITDGSPIHHGTFALLLSTTPSTKTSPTNFRLSIQ